MIKVLRFAIITMVLLLLAFGCATMNSNDNHAVNQIKRAEITMNDGSILDFAVPEDFPDDWSHAAKMPLGPFSTLNIVQVSTGDQPDMILYSVFYAWVIDANVFEPLYATRCKYLENPTKEMIAESCTCWIYCESGESLFPLPIMRAMDSLDIMSMTPGDFTIYLEMQKEFCGKSCKR